MAKKKPTRPKREKPQSSLSPLVIKVVGIGGGGGNAVARISREFVRGVEFIAINTDHQDLDYCEVRHKVYIGKNLTHGLGTGMNPELGRQAAEENRSEIADALKGADMVFITAGFGGGTGTGASPLVAEIAQELKNLTVAGITKPFSFEGAQRSRIAQEGINKLKDRVDTLITIPNDRIFSLIGKETSLFKAFEEIDEVLKNSVLGITELITSTGIVNVDFADVQAIMQDSGSALIGIGKASGAERSVNAANIAINSPLLEDSIDGAKGVLFGISGHRDLKMTEINEVARLISENVDQSAKIIFGAYYDRKLKKGQLKVTLVATGFNGIISHKNNVSLPNLFASSEEVSSVKKEVNQGEGSLSDKNKKIFNSKEKVDKNESEEAWDIPAFLRKKRKSH